MDGSRFSPPAPERSAGRGGVRLGAVGSTLVEALAALTLAALAAAVVASAAVANLRAVRAASRLEQTLATATAELSALQARRPFTAQELVHDQPALGPAATSSASVQLLDERVVALAVSVRIAPDAPPVALATRMLVPE